ncbi:unnamed protein product, partial [Rotaria socialis]
IRQRWRSIMQEFALNAPTHCISGIARSQNKQIECSGHYRSSSSVGLHVSEWPQNFAAFTIYNVAHINHDQFIEPFLNYANILNITNTNDTRSFSLL